MGRFVSLQSRTWPSGEASSPQVRWRASDGALIRNARMVSRAMVGCLGREAGRVASLALAGQIPRLNLPFPPGLFLAQQILFESLDLSLILGMELFKLFLLRHCAYRFGVGILGCLPPTAHLLGV